MHPQRVTAHARSQTTICVEGSFKYFNDRLERALVVVRFCWSLLSCDPESVHRVCAVNACRHRPPAWQNGRLQRQPTVDLTGRGDFGRTIDKSKYECKVLALCQREQKIKVNLVNIGLLNVFETEAVMHCAQNYSNPMHCLFQKQRANLDGRSR